MSKKNLPHIPIYVGDWEKDCNILSCQAEGAWFRIVRKLFTKGKQSSIKIPTKSLQNLWSVSESEMQLILKELEFNEICGISYHTGFVKFTCRRYLKENQISEIRSKARKSAYDKNKTSTKPKQIKNKNLQITDNDNDNDIDNDIDINIIPSFSDFWNLYDYKINKPKSKKLWEKISQKERELIMDHIIDYKDSTPDKKYRKHPSTYLNSKGWEDEIIKNNERGINKEFANEILRGVQS